MNKESIWDLVVEELVEQGSTLLEDKVTARPRDTYSRFIEDEKRDLDQESIYLGDGIYIR